jgi:hypothetical protein
VLPYAFVLAEEPDALRAWCITAERGHGTAFDFQLFGAALSIGIALVTQIAEQVDYLRFMPVKTAANRRRWWAAVMLGGPGWVVPGVLKMLGGALLAWLALRNAVPAERAIDPNQMYLIGFSHVFDNTSLAIAATVVFVIVSQLKINVTNAYAGSLAWSNVFARLTHSHPGRVVWVVFNCLIALMLMELNVFQAIGQVLGLYSNIAISWMAAVVADLVINKPSGCRLPGWSSSAATCTTSTRWARCDGDRVGALHLRVCRFVRRRGGALRLLHRAGRRLRLLAADRLGDGGVTTWCACGGICRRRLRGLRAPYEGGDGPLPGLPGADLLPVLLPRCPLPRPLQAGRQPVGPVAGPAAPGAARAAQPYIDTGLAHYLLLMAGIVPLLALILGVLYTHEVLIVGADDLAAVARLQDTFVKTFAALLMLSGVLAWWMVLTQKSRRVAQEESNRQTQLLMQEIESHRRRTDTALQQANQAKSRYITAISHELRSPLNSILGYAQILAADDDIPPNRRQAVSVIRKSGDHLLSVIERTLDIARIEGGKLTLDIKAMDFRS